MKTDLGNDKIKSLLSYYLYASVVGMVIKSIHLVLDGIFLGNKVGANALASVNIIMPVFSFFMAVAIMIGVGSSTLIAIKLGENKREEAQEIFIQSMIVIIISSIISQVVFLYNTESICRWLGANDAVIEGTVTYGTVLVWFSVVAVIGMSLSVLIRNDGNPKLSMYGVVLSALTNIVLNYIFIYPMDMGLFGAGLATGIAQLVNLLVVLLHFVFKQGALRIVFAKPTINKRNLIRTIQIGIPSFVGEISFGIVDLMFNRVLMGIGGEVSVAAFSIIMYIKSLAYMVFRGIEQAMQPIISFNYGAFKYDRVYETYRLAIKISVISALTMSIFGIAFANQSVMLFNQSNIEMINLAAEGVRYIFITMVFAACNTCISGYFQAIGYAKISTIVTLSRSVLCEFFMLLLLSRLWGVTGVWLAFPVSEVLFFLVGVYLMKTKQKVIARIY